MVTEKKIIHLAGKVHELLVRSDNWQSRRSSAFCHMMAFSIRGTFPDYLSISPKVLWSSTS